MTTTLNLPVELVQRVERRALLQGRPVDEVVAEILERELRSNPSPSSPGQPASAVVEIGPNGLPLIRGAPDAPASRLSTAEILQLEHDVLLEEDLKRAGLTP